MKIKFTKNYKHYKKGDEKEVSTNVAFGLLDKGVAKEAKKGVEKRVAGKEIRAKKNKMVTKSKNKCL